MEEDLLAARKEKFAVYFKQKHGVLALILLALASFAFWLRTRNLSGLRDATTGGWTLGPDLDPFLFLRWAKSIVAHGSLMDVDPLRYVPLPYYTSGELPGIPYLIAWFHTIASPWWTSTVEHSAVVFPAFMFALTAIVFFLLVRTMFITQQGEKKSTLIAAIATFFLIVTPTLLPRTVGGIPEKESVGFLLLFLALYLFISAWRSQKKTTAWLLALLAGAVTAAMNLTWGGAAYILFTLSITSLIAFVLGQVTRARAGVIALWFGATIFGTFPFTTRFGATFFEFLQSYGLAIPQLITLATLAAFCLHALLVRETPLARIVNRVPYAVHIPRPLLSLMLIALLALVVILVAAGPSFVTGKFMEVKNNLVNPITDRLGVTVAENRQPFFAEWANSFGPVVQGTPLVFWLFLIGSIVLFYQSTTQLGRKEQLILTLAYTLFLAGTIFSRYTPDGALNGTNALSLLVYPFLSFVVLGVALLYIYYEVHHRHHQESLQRLDVGVIALLVLFFLSIASARGAVRLIMMLVPPASMLVAYLAVAAISGARKAHDDILKSVGWIAVILIVCATLFAGIRYYEESKALAQSYVPGVYNQQWQRAMSWVRTNAPDNAVFAHWWDYGYWVQSLGERATILDGGNAIPYWNHLMGRHVLTGRDKASALEFLYTHKATHLLIDSTDIGKYGAFSSIGSDEHYDRRSWIPTLSRARIEEAKNHTLIYYQGGFPLDQDFVYHDENGTVELPEGKAVLGAVILEQANDGTLAGQPRGIYAFQKSRASATTQHTLPLRYAYYNNTLYDYGRGVEAGIVSLPTVTPQGSVERNAGIMYLSNKTVQSHLARLYLYNQLDANFPLAHSEDDYIVQQLKSAHLLAPNEDFVIYQGLRGPIRIWEIKYPDDVQANPQYLSKEYPEHLRRA